MSRCLHFSLIVAAGLVAGAAAAMAQPPQDSAVAWTSADAGLQWGPCPSFLPSGCQIAVLHGEPGQPNADVFFKVPGGVELPGHWHHSAERMVLVSGELQVSYEGQKAMVMRAGSYAYGPPQRPHSGKCISKVPCVLFIAFEQPIDASPTQ